MKKGIRRDCGVGFGLSCDLELVEGLGIGVGMGGLSRGLDLCSSNKPGFVNRNINGDINRGLDVELLKGGL